MGRHSAPAAPAVERPAAGAMIAAGTRPTHRRGRHASAVATQAPAKHTRDSVARAGMPPPSAAPAPRAQIQVEAPTPDVKPDPAVSAPVDRVPDQVAPTEAAQPSASTAEAPTPGVQLLAWTAFAAAIAWVVIAAAGHDLLDATGWAVGVAALIPVALLAQAPARLRGRRERRPDQ